MIRPWILVPRRVIFYNHLSFIAGIAEAYCKAVILLKRLAAYRGGIAWKDDRDDEPLFAFWVHVPVARDDPIGLDGLHEQVMVTAADDG